MIEFLWFLFLLMLLGLFIFLVIIMAGRQTGAKMRKAYLKSLRDAHADQDLADEQELREFLQEIEDPEIESIIVHRHDTIQ